MDSLNLWLKLPAAMNTLRIVSLLFVLSLSACATPTVDRTASAFNNANYDLDLEECRGGANFMASVQTVGTVVIGSAYGALTGVHLAWSESETAEAAMVGAAIGGVIGLGTGAVDALENHQARVARCLMEKGYVIAGYG